MLNRKTDEFRLVWEWLKCESRAGGVLGSGICGESRKIRSADWWAQLPTRSPYVATDRDLDASCETGRLRAQQRLTPWKGLSVVLSP